MNAAFSLFSAHFGAAQACTRKERALSPVACFCVALCLVCVSCLGAEQKQGNDRAAQPASLSDSNALPLSTDLRPLFDKWGLQRSVQGDRPTCSALTVLGALEFAIAKRQGHTPRLSVEFLNWAANKACGNTNDGGF